MRKFRQSPEHRAGPTESGDKSVTATEAQNNFGQVLGSVARGDMVYITRYDRPEAVVLSIEKFNALAGPDSSSLDDLTHEFDDRLARMQSAEAAAGMDTFFELTSAELGEAALRGARRKPM